jgi:signal transduction histidine kinase
MLRIINSAVDLSVKMLDELRNQTRESPLELEEYDLAELVDEAVKESIPPPKIQIQSRVEGFVSVRIDRIKMRRVLDNLIRNGCDAMPNGGVLLITGSDEGDGVVITVQDQGEGIPDAVKANLFKPFMTTKENGTGLGLPFCKRVVDAHGGQISFTSSQGKGTTFTIRLRKQHGMLPLGEQLFTAPA